MSRELADGLQRVDGVLAGDVVLALDLVAVARREAHAEVGEPVPPRAGHAELAGAVDRVELDDRVALDGRGASRRRAAAGFVAAS